MDPRSSFAPQCNQVPCKWMIFLPRFQRFGIQSFWKLHVWYSTAVWDDLRELLVSWHLPLFKQRRPFPGKGKWEIGMHTHLSHWSQWSPFSRVAPGSQYNGCFVLLPKLLQLFYHDQTRISMHHHKYTLQVDEFHLRLAQTQTPKSAPTSGVDIEPRIQETRFAKSIYKTTIGEWPPLLVCIRCSVDSPHTRCIATRTKGAQ